MRKKKFDTVGSRMLTLADGGSLLALKKKGNLTHVEELYNPSNYFSEVHILVFDKLDLTVSLRNQTLKVHYLRHLPGKLGLMMSLPYLLFQAIRIVHQYKIQIIRARNAYLSGFLGVLMGKLTGIPVVVSLGGDNRLAQKLIGHYYGGNRFLSYRLEEFSLRKANRIFCVNEFTRQYAIRLGARLEKTRIVPHTLDIDPATYHYDEILARKEFCLDDDPIILVIGRLERDKQVDVVIEAIPLINKNYSRARFIFVGDGRLREELESRVKDLQIQQIVKFVGFQPRQNIVKFLAAATIVCIPMSGFVIYEAAAAKKPMVAFDVEWHSEFIKNDETGLLVKNRDVDELVQAIIKLLDNPKHAAALASNAHQMLRDRFDRQTIIEKEIAAYQEVIF